MCKNVFPSVVVVALLLQNTLARADDAEEIRNLVPSAAAIRRDHFQAMAKYQLKFPWFENNALTWILLFMPAPVENSPRDDFSGLGRTPKATDWARELDRADYSLLAKDPEDPSKGATLLSKIAFAASAAAAGPVTAIHAERITDFTCEVHGDTATGVVAFEVPELYRGKVQYVAKRSGKEWRISEFRMPASGIHVVHEKGIWKLHYAKGMMGKTQSLPYPFRTWRDATGQHDIEAAWISYWDGKVRLLKRDGQVIGVPPDKLSEEDRQWLKDQPGPGSRF